jgi:ATP-dependent DNA ligase
MKYDTFRYIFPPRPEYKVQPSELPTFKENWVCQPKYNGDCVVIFTNGSETHVYNRRKEVYSKKLGFDLKELSYLSPEWFVFVGENLNPKRKLGEDGTMVTDRVVLFDCLVANSKYLLGYTLWERIKIIHTLFEPFALSIGEDGKLDGTDLMMQTDIEGLYIATTFCTDLHICFDRLSQIDICEGLVVKDSNAPLLPAFNEKNNELWQFKCRKPTKLYNF